MGAFPKIRAIILTGKQKYSKAGIVIRAGILKGEGKARESEIYPRERGRPKCSIMIRLWAFVKMGMGNLERPFQAWHLFSCSHLGGSHKPAL